MRKPVTSDLAVLKAWPKVKKGDASFASSQIAEALGITVFQITARLKGMEGRGFVARNAAGRWEMTPQGEAERENPSPSVSGQSKTMRVRDANGVASGPPDDKKVPKLRIKRSEWVSSEQALRESQRRLPEIQERIASYRATDPKRFKREIMALEVEKEHCLSVIKQKRKGCWTSRIVKADPFPFTVFIAPDQKEYVHARPFETADLLLESVPGMKPVRLRLYQTSALLKKEKKVQTEKEKREQFKLEQKQAERNARVTEEEREEEARGDVRGVRKKIGIKPPADDEHRSKAEAAFWSLSVKERNRIRREKEYETYEEWYDSTRTKGKADKAARPGANTGKARAASDGKRTGNAAQAARGRKEGTRSVAWEGGRPNADRKGRSAKQKGRR